MHALRGVSLDVPQGAIVAVLGSNGAGKSTLLRALSGTLPMHRGAVDSGTLTVDGRSLVGLDPAAIVRLGVVQVPEGRRIFGRLTVEENLRIGGVGRAGRGGGSARAQVEELFPILGERRSQRACLLSGGEQQMLAMGRALMAQPRLLLLDEPSLGLAPRVVTQVGQIVCRIRDAGTTVVLVEQNAAMALAVADRAYVLEVGEVVLSGSAEELRGTDSIRDLYLGHGSTRESIVAAAEDRHLSAWVA